MTRYIKVAIIYGVLILLTKENAFSQNIQQSRKYRVIAFKTGNSGISSMSNETEVVPTMYIYIPNSFTPNNDGLNDTFGVSGEAIQSFSMQIFNRWGDLVFESKNLTKQWDGTYNGSKASEGTYVYKVYASSITGKKTSREGTVNLIQ